MGEEDALNCKILQDFNKFLICDLGVVNTGDQHGIIRDLDDGLLELFVDECLVVEEVQCEWVDEVCGKNAEDHMNGIEVGNALR